MRNIGLDLFRTFAILFVLISHSRHLFSYIQIDGFNWWWLSIGGYLGVELFFVLSGFLIGNILIKDVLFSENKKKSIKTFFIRRWFRTLPLYFIILFINVLVYLYINKSFYFPYLHLLFLQNFDSFAVGFFDVSWSLSVEEWFYILIPLILLFFVKEKKHIIYVLLGIICLVISIKSIDVLYFEQNWTDIRKNIPFRFSSLCIGVILSYINIYHQKIFEYLSKNIVYFPTLFFMLFIVLWYYYKEQIGLDNDFFSKVFMFEFTSILLAIIMVRFYFRVKRNNFFIFYGSRLSYSIYLIHMLYLKPFIDFAQYEKSIFLSILLFLAFLLLTFFTSFLLFKYIEMPILNFRNKITN